MKFMNMKRFGSIAMAGALALSLTAPAFAESNNQTVVDGGYQATPISVVVPTTGTATINPYGLPVVVASRADESAISIADQQITNVPMYIANYGTTPLDVNATLAVLPKGGVSIKGGALVPATDKGKEMNVTLEVVGLNDDALKKTTEDESLGVAVFEKYADDATWTGLTATNKLVAPAAAKDVTTVTPAKSGAALATLGAATVSGETVTYGAKSIALFRLSGKVIESPNDGATPAVDTPWAAADGFEANIVFTFKPTPKTVIIAGTHSGTLTNASIPTKAWVDDTVTFTFEAATGKNCTAAITGQKTGATAPTVTITEDANNAGHYTGTFKMCEAQAAAGITLAITVPA